MRNKLKDTLSSIRSHPELAQLAINPNNENYLSINELNNKISENKNIDEKLFRKIETMDTYPDVGGGELLLNYDLQYRKRIDEINVLKQINGDMMDEKDMELLRRDLEESFAAGMAKVIDSVNSKMLDLDKKVKSIDKQAEQTCKDGNCTLNAIKELKKDIDNINVVNSDKMNDLETNITKINNENVIKTNDTIKEMNERIETVCTGVDCLTKTLEDKENTVTCPVCGGKFIWSNQTHCPLCSIPLEPVP